MGEAKAVCQTEDGTKECGLPQAQGSSDAPGCGGEHDHGQGCGHDHGTGPPKDFLDTTKPAWEGFPDVTTSAEAHVFAQKLIADFNDARDARIKTHQGVDAPDVPLSGPAAEDPRRRHAVRRDPPDSSPCDDSTQLRHHPPASPLSKRSRLSSLGAPA